MNELGDRVIRLEETVKNIIKSMDALPDVDKRLRRVENLIWGAAGALGILQVIIELLLKK